MNKFLGCLIVLVGTFSCDSLVAQQSDSRVEEFKSVYADYQSLATAGDFSRAAPKAAKALELGEPLFGENHANTAALTYNYGDALLQLGYKKIAKEVLTSALKRYEAVYGKDSEELIPVLMDLGKASLHSGKGGSKRKFRRALKLIAKYDGKESDAYANASLEVGAALMAENDYPEAKGYLDDAYQIYQANHGPDHPSMGLASFLLGKYWLWANDFEVSRDFFLMTLGTFDDADAPSNEIEMSTHAFLVTVYENLEQSDKATEHCLAIGRMSPAHADQDYQPLYRVHPEYPSSAQWAGREGFVDLSFTVDEQGFVRDPVVVESEGGRFENVVFEAIEKWRYAPRFVDNKAVATEDVHVRLTFKFSD